MNAVRSALRRAAVAAALVGIAAGCPVRRPSVPAVPASGLEGPAALGKAQRAADGGRYVDADRALTTFAEQYAGSPEAAEAMYWRAVLLLDPANKDGSTKAAAQTLDAYLALDSVQHRVEASLLRRMADLVASLAADVQATKTAPPPVPPPAPALKEKDEEILRLRDSLTKTSAELERVRRRLAPRP